MKHYLSWLLLATLSFFISSCSSDDDGPSLSNVKIQITSNETISDFGVFRVTLKETKSNTTFSATPDSKTGVASLQVPLGAYDIMVEDPVDGVSTRYGHVENYVVAQGEATKEVRVQAIINGREPSFVLDELYFNGDKNGDFDMLYYESYITIRNVSQRPLYADGLSIAICGDYNAVDQNPEMSNYLQKDSVVISQLFTIPGEGRSYKVEPGQSIVIAHSAINHKLGADGKEDPSRMHSINLSGAHFELYVPGAMTADEAEVKNMIVDYAASQAFNWGYTGQTPIMLVKMSQKERAQLVGHTVNMSMPLSYNKMKLNYLLLPKSAIIDGVETGTADNMLRKVLPDGIDRGHILVNTAYGFDGQFVQRKRISNKNGVETVQDTNNSSADFEVIAHGQKSYPRK